MQEKSLPRVSLTPEAFKVVKIQCLEKGISAKNYLSDLVLQNSDERTLNFINNESNIQIDIDSGKKDSNAISEAQKTDLSTNNVDQSKKIFFLDANVLYSFLFPNPLLGQTAKEISNAMGIDFEDVNAALEKMFDEGEIYCRERGAELEYWKPAKASIETCQVYEFISTDPAHANTPEEIKEKLSGLSKSVVQTSLYWLLKEGRVKRRLREDPENRRKNSWEYWKDEALSNVPLEIRDVDMDLLLEHIPKRDEGKPIGVTELSKKLNKPPSTIRGALRRLQRMGYVRKKRALEGLPPSKDRYYRVN